MIAKGHKWSITTVSQEGVAMEIRKIPHSILGISQAFQDLANIRLVRGTITTYAIELSLLCPLSIFPLASPAMQSTFHTPLEFFLIVWLSDYTFNVKLGK